MNEDRINIISRQAARFAVMIVGIVLALAVGAPWLLYDAPPSPEAVFAVAACCATGPATAMPQPATAIAPGR